MYVCMYILVETPQNSESPPLTYLHPYRLTAPNRKRHTGYPSTPGTKRRHSYTRSFRSHLTILHTHLRLYFLTYIHTYIPTVHRKLPTYVPHVYTDPPTHPPTYIHTHSLRYIPMYIPTTLAPADPSALDSCFFFSCSYLLPCFYVHTYIHTYIFIFS